MKETMLDRARSELSFLDLIISNISRDDCMVNYAAYNLQQACEFALKYAIEMHGERYPHTHDIEELLAYGESAGIDFNLLLGNEVYEKLALMAETLTAMESKSRYVLNFRNSLNTVLNGRDLVTAIVAKLSEQTNVEPDTGVSKLNFFK